jgi:hypothetical protein
MTLTSWRNIFVISLTKVCFDINKENIERLLLGDYNAQ